MLSEVFTGAHISEGIALTTIRELRAMGGHLHDDALASTQHFVTQGTFDRPFVYQLLGSLFRIEAKFPVCFVIGPDTTWKVYGWDWVDRSPPPPPVVALPPGDDAPPPPPPPGGDAPPPPPMAPVLVHPQLVQVPRPARTLALNI